MDEIKCFGIAGWKNSGKTSLVSGLVSELISRGLKVSTIKHAHHSFDLDQPGTDSFKHREAGAHEVVLVSGRRWAIQHELVDEEEPALNEFLGKLSPCDIVLVEGYKYSNIAKLEIIGPDSTTEKRLWETDQNIMAIACDTELTGCPLPRYERSDVAGIADFILEFHQLSD